MKTLLFAIYAYLHLGSVIANTSGVCETSTSANQLLKCLVENHPRMLANKSDLQAAQFGIEQGEQRPNPSIIAQSIGGEQYGQKINETSVQYLHTFELGGKRAARIDKAQAEFESVQAQAFGTLTSVYSEVTLSLYRLQQTARELAIIQETIVTFNKILKSYNSRPALSPEQKVSKNVFEFAVKDYENQRNSLQITMSELQIYFTSLSLASNEKILSLASKLTFSVNEIDQKFDLASSNKKEKSPELQLAEAQFKAAQADLDLQKSETWGNLEIGPIYQYRYEEGNGYPVVGVGFTLPLPLYNQNSGGKQKTLHQMRSMEHLKNYEIRKTQNEWPILISNFKQSVKNIKEQFSKDDMEKKHHELESLFYRGLVSSSLIVEAHRQMLDLTLSQHEQQLRVLQLLFRAYALNGEQPKDYL